MKETVSVNISGRKFTLDTDAFQCLTNYLNKLKSWFKGKESGDEIISDIEGRIAELLSQKIKPDIDVVTIKLVEETIAIMGQPEDFEDDDKSEAADNQGQTNGYSALNDYQPKKLFRDIDDKILGGVCAGLAVYFNLDITMTRILMALIIAIVPPGGLIIYFALWLIVPQAITTAQKLAMKGEFINVSNIEKKVKEDGDGNKSDSDTFGRSQEYFRKKDQKTRNLIMIILGFLIIAFAIPTITFKHHINNFHFGYPFDGLSIYFLPIKIVIFMIIALVIIVIANKRKANN